jgi:hypothetical protein
VLAGLAHLSARIRRQGWPDDRRIAVLVGLGILAFGVLFAALPPSPDPVGVPANLVWQFRLNSLTGNLLVWTLLTVGLGVVWTGAARHAPAAAAGVTSAGATTGGATADGTPDRGGTSASAAGPGAGPARG